MRNTLPVSLFTGNIRVLGCNVRCVIFDSVMVDRHQTSGEMLLGIHRKKDIDHTIISNMPRGGSNCVTVALFCVDRDVNHTMIRALLRELCMNPADPYSLAEVNNLDSLNRKESPEFIARNNCTFWDESCCMDFFDLEGEAVLEISRHSERVCKTGTWIAGIPVDQDEEAAT